DTMWMKGYILAANNNTITDSTGIAYIELINNAGEVVKRTAAPCYWGRFQSSIPLTADNFPQGSYTLRAYTSWMRNFGDSLLYESRFTIINPRADEWNARIREVKFTGSRITLTAGLTTNTLAPVARKKISVKIRAKNRNLLRLQTQTDGEGNLYIDTMLKNNPDNKDLVIEIADKEDLKIQVPVKAAGQSAIDLQFLPEGGSFIAGKEQRLGFKALNVYGKGMEAKGVIRDAQGQEVAKFATIHRGMGVVAFTPKNGSHYTAFPENGKPVPLPDPQPSGTLLQVQAAPASDSIRVMIDGTPDLYGRKYYFAATAAGISFARGSVTLSSKPIRLHIAKEMIPSGIARLTLYDSLMRPVNERAIFIWHKDPLQLSLVSDKEIYRKKDSVSLLLTAQTAGKQHLSGSFSIAVIDTSQVNINQQSENILSYMLLSSDLKGTIEDPYYYFQSPLPQAVDALMLTQGWVRYEWQPANFTFDREKEFMITGKATNIFNKPFARTKVTVFGKEGKNGVFLMDTTTNDKGVFTLEHFPYFTNDSISMVIEAFNKKGRAFNIGIELNEPTFPSYTNISTAIAQQNILLDTATAHFVNKQMDIRKLIRKNGDFLDEVVVKTTAAIAGSKNLNKNGGADQVVSEATLDKTPKQTLLDVLYKQVKGFRLSSPPRSTQLLYMINTNIVRFIIDGVDLHFFYNQEGGGGSMNDYQLFVDSYLKYFSAEDIRAIEIMNTSKYNSNYRSMYLTMEEQMNSGPATRDFSFVEITTRSGSGPFLKKTPGIYLYKPVAPVLAKQFYSPRYTTPDEKTVVPDLRTTVYWNPEVITDHNGKARVSFYTSESAGNYMIIVQGTNLAGGLGVLYQPLKLEETKN
ncbi:Plug domain-containing protein, partial [Niabella drilacis]